MSFSHSILQVKDKSDKRIKKNKNKFHGTETTARPKTSLKSPNKPLIATYSFKYSSVGYS